MKGAILWRRVKTKRDQLKKKNESLNLANVSDLDEDSVALADIESLKSQFKDNSLSCHQLMTICVTRALKHGKRLHWTADTMYAEALENARKCD